MGDYVRVKDLIEMLSKANPNAIVCASEKRGRGGAVNPDPVWIPSPDDFDEPEYWDKCKERYNVPLDEDFIEISCGY